MLRKTRRSSLWLGFLILLTLSAILASPSSSSINSVSVAVHNDAGAPLGLLAQAENIATRVFEQAGVNVKWINCPVATQDSPDAEICRKASFPAYFQQRIVSRHASLAQSSFGVSYMSSQGIGCYSYVFYQRVAELVAEQGGNEQNTAVLLGHVMAHELAHLLLGTNSHSASGIMRAHWYTQELASADRGALLFTPDQARVMIERLRQSEQNTQSTSRLGAEGARISEGSDR